MSAGSSWQRAGIVAATVTLGAVSLGAGSAPAFDGPPQEIRTFTGTTPGAIEEALAELQRDPTRSSLAANRSRTAASLQSGAGTAETTPSAEATPSVEGNAAAETTPTDRVEVRTVTETVEIPAPAEQRVDDPALAAGTVTAAQQAAPGTATVTTQISTVNGVETARTELSRVTVREPVPGVVHVGTKPALRSQGSRVFFDDEEFGVNWDGLAYCESTNNPKAEYHPSGYPSTFGLFQFDLETWQSVDGVGNPADATPEEQLLRAKLLYAKRGLEPWLCASAAGGPPPA